MLNGGERAWVEHIKKHVQDSLPDMLVDSNFSLPYTSTNASYGGETADEPIVKTHRYKTDLLVREKVGGGWIPRVVIECKLEKIGTHGALTYSAKAATHKNVHPYLRYGIVIGGFPKPVPGRLVRHGQQFDFMLTLGSRDLTPKDRERLCSLVKEEVQASQQLSALFSGELDQCLVHRRLFLES